MARKGLMMTNTAMNNSSQWLNMVELPAGSGKTTRIHQQIKEWHEQHPYDNILAITYTERAAAELSEGMEQEDRITTSTIHSFVANFLSPLLKCPEVVDAYFKRPKDINNKEESIEESIEKYIQNNKHKDNIKRYREKYGQEPTLKLIKAKAYKTGIRYSRTRYGSLLHSRLSHDDLLIFFAQLAQEFTVIKQRIGKKYNLIIIDEFQDTKSYILSTFANIAKEFSTPLWIYGDRMQQIYTNNDAELNNVLSEFKNQPLEIVNHRSRPGIVFMLNQLANNSSEQKCDSNKYSDDEIKNDTQSVLKAYLTPNPTSKLETLRRNHGDALTLVLFNKNRFKNYGMSSLYEAYNKCKEYGYNSEHSAVEILLPDRYDEAIDDIDRVVLTLIEAGKLVENNKYGEALCLLDQEKDQGIFNTQSRNTNVFLTKKMLCEKIKNLETLYDLIKKNNSTLELLVKKAIDFHIITDNWYHDITGEKDSIFSNVKFVLCEQFINQYNRLVDSDVHHVSTQHGVKGESHDSVIFVAENSTNHAPRLNMYGCLRLLCSDEAKDFNLDYLVNNQNRIYSFQKKYFTEHQSIDTQKDFTEEYKSNPAPCISFLNAIKSDFHNKSTMDKLFYDICWNGTIDSILSKYHGGKIPKSDLNAIYNIKPSVDQLVSAFRIFYVGCSRARSELRIILDTREMQGWEAAARTKLAKLGFTIIDR